MRILYHPTAAGNRRAALLAAMAHSLRVDWRRIERARFAWRLHSLTMRTRIRRFRAGLSLSPVYWPRENDTGPVRMGPPRAP